MIRRSRNTHNGNTTTTNLSSSTMTSSMSSTSALHDQLLSPSTSQSASHDSYSDFDERSSLVTSRLAATSIAASTTMTQYDDDDLLMNIDDNADNWESIHNSARDLEDLPPTHSLQYRLLYWTFVSFPTLLGDMIRLAGFVLLLAPGFCSFLRYYVTCDRMSVYYKNSSDRSVRNTMDIYGTTLNIDATHNGSLGAKPVLVFFTGGAWVIGYKMWGAFLAKVFCAMGVIVVVPDYRNYPLCTVPAMVQDTQQAIQWTLDNIDQYGGDPTKVMLAGQSAGGHLVSVVLLQKALKIIKGEPTTGFKPTDLLGFCSISAPSDVQAMATNFQKHGLDQSFVQSLFGVKANSAVSMDDNDPQRLVEQLQRLIVSHHQEGIIEEEEEQEERNPTSNNSNGNQLSLDKVLPPMSIFHGTADQTVPFEVSERYAASLQEVGVQAEYIQYEGWSHTDPILEAIMMADHRFHADMYDRLYQWIQNKNPSGRRSTQLADKLEADTMPECQQLCPAPLIKAARFCNPF